MIFCNLPEILSEISLIIGKLSEVSSFIRNGITYLQLLLPQIAIAITLCPLEKQQAVYCRYDSIGKLLQHSLYTEYLI
jgi:hypothetical protein